MSSIELTSQGDALSLSLPKGKTELLYFDRGKTQGSRAWVGPAPEGRWHPEMGLFLSVGRLALTKIAAEV